MTNDSNVSNGSLPMALLIYSWISLTVLTIPAALINLVALIYFSFDQKLSKAVRISLCNVLIGCLTVAASGIMSNLSVLINGYKGLGTSAIFCHFYTLMYLIGQGSRLSFMPMLAITVYVLVRYGEPTKTRKRRTIFFIATGTLWIFLVLLATLSFSPEAVIISKIQDLLCFVQVSRTPLGYISAGIYLSVFGIFSYILTVVVGITGVCFVKHSTVRDTRALKATAKFTFFLLIGNTVGLLGQLVPLLFGAIDLKEDVEKAITTEFASTSIIFMSLYPTPILILVYFKAFGRFGKVVLHCKRLCIYQ